MPKFAARGLTTAGSTTRPVVALVGSAAIRRRQQPYLAGLGQGLPIIAQPPRRS